MATFAGHNYANDMMWYDISALESALQHDMYIHNIKLYFCLKFQAYITKWILAVNITRKLRA